MTPEVIEKLLHANNCEKDPQAAKRAKIGCGSPKRQVCRGKAAHQHGGDQQRCVSHLLDERHWRKELLHERHIGGKKKSGGHAGTILCSVRAVMSSSWPKACAELAMASAGWF